MVGTHKKDSGKVKGVGGGLGLCVYLVATEGRDSWWVGGFQGQAWKKSEGDVSVAQ